MEVAQKWYIVKSIDGTCEIFPSRRVENQDDPNIVDRWGPFQTPEEALARRFGLICTGKCQPS